MLLTSEEFDQMARSLALSPGGDVGFDVETTGLRPYQGSKAFLLGFTDTKGEKFSVKLLPDSPPHESLRLLFSNPKITYCAHNAKFELGFLDAQFGIRVLGFVWDTEVNARIECNIHFSYNLQACALRIGESKYQAMLDWLKERGNKNAYHVAPEAIITPYVEQDAWLSWRLRKHQCEIFTHWDTSSPVKIRNVVTLEKTVLPHLFEMERNGLLVDVAYCKRAEEYEQREIERAKNTFLELSGTPFVDSRKTLQPVFDRNGICYGKTELGNASFTGASVASSKDHALVRTLLAHRRAVKRLSAYWQNFLDLENNGIIHPSINQNRAQTGRMSISDPSCQNWATDEDDGTSFPIRRAFIARPDCFIASLDYSQMELRKASDEAENHPMIERILSGADLHQEVADAAGVPRSLAKNGRFAQQYGAGIPKIAETLGVNITIARAISDAIAEQAKATTAYSRYLGNMAKHSYGYDWLGRRFYFDHGFEYKAFNYRIQGGCAEILKIAICDIALFLKKHASEQTFMLVPIHDEIVLNMHENDKHLLPEIKRLMIAAHRDKKTLAMDVNIAIGPNFHDLTEYLCEKSSA